jgi:hypothetical protein
MPPPLGVSDTDYALRRHGEGRLIGLRINRYSWWTHWRELADYMLPRRYKWLITPNQMSRGSPINQHILDSTATLAARNCASGMMSGISSPTRPWFKLSINRIDSTQTSPISLWLAECERLMMLVFQESNFYNSLAILYFDLVIFGTAVMLIYEDYDDIINCYNPCLGEYYVDIDGFFRPSIFYREFTLTVDQTVDQFGIDNVSPAVRRLFEDGTRAGAQLTRELIVAHAIEPNDDGRAREFGIPESFGFREWYWEWGGSTSPQGGTSYSPGLLRKRGFHEAPNVTVRWDLVSNDPYGRSPGMDALPDVKQLQQEVRRKAQAIDKHVNPPMVADIQLKNQPASLLPGGVTYVAGMTTGKVGFAPVYTVQPDISGMVEDLAEVRARIKEVFFNNLFQTASQYETRSNVTAVEWDMRRAESLVLLGPVLERIQYELLSPIIERTFAIMSRSGVLPPPPAAIQGRNIDIEYVSMLATAQAAAATAGIERVLQLAGNLAGIDPAAVDNIDIDFALEDYSHKLNNDPKMIRSPEMLQAIRQNRQRQQEQAQQAEMAEKLAAGAQTLSQTDVGGGKNALQHMLGGGIP